MKRQGYKLIIFILLPVLSFYACQNNNPLAVDVSHIPAKVNIKRFDLDFYGQSPYQLPVLKQKYPYMFPAYVPDSVWIKKMQDSLLLDLKTQVDSVFSDLKAYKPQIVEVFKHIKYYYPRFKEPDIITLYSDWNYLKKAVYLDSLELLTLDNFLGSNNRLYKGIPKYIRENMNPDQIPVAIAFSIADMQVKPTRSKTFLSKMINYGKKYYLLDAYLPQAPDSIKLGYDAQKMQWAKDNEEGVWQYFIDRELLYSTNDKLDLRFLNLAPYSKFYTEQDMQSPGYIGRYIGWQIVKSYMTKNKVSLQKLLDTPEEDIFKKSKYKPKK
jgi:gliding motility-associated lipoprotein GldB